MTGIQAGESARWEADVVLRDGRTARLRAIGPDDAEALREFHSGLSEQTVYFRFFAPHPELTEQELRTFTEVDQVDRVALVVTMRGAIMGVGRFDRITSDEAEVAFVIRDDLQGLGLGSLLLEHLASVAREKGITRFVADVLPANGRMLATFRYAGFAMEQTYDEGVVTLSLDLQPTQESERVREAREQRNEARSLQPLLRPRSIVVVGVSRREGSIGRSLLRNLITSGYDGPIYVVHPSLNQVMGIPCHPSIGGISRADEQPIDLAVISVAAEEVASVLADAAQAGVRAAIVVSGGFEDDRALIDLASLARDSGIRLLGPAALGVVSTSHEIPVNASLLPAMPISGRIGFFCQSGALALDIMHRMEARGLGVATFVSAGHRADVSGNDLLQFWEEDDSIDLVLMYLETVGNPRKFARLARRVARHTPVVVLHTRGMGHSPSESEDRLPSRAWEQILADTGVIEVTSLDRMLDVAEVLSVRGSLGRGRIGLVGNSEALEILARNAAEQQGLQCAAPSWTLARGSSPHQFRRCLDSAMRDPAVDVVVALYVPPVESTDDEQTRHVIAEFASTVSKPIVAIVLGRNAGDLRAIVRGRRGAVLPVFTDVEHAICALGDVLRYTRSLDDTSHVTIAVEGCDAVRARSEAHRLTLASADGSVALHGTAADVLLGCYRLPGCADHDDDTEVLSARILGVRDAALGAVVSVGVDAWWAEQIGEESYSLAPLTQQEAARMIDRSLLVRSPDPVSERYRFELADAVRRVGALLHDVPHVDRVDLRRIRPRPATSPAEERMLVVGSCSIMLQAAPRGPADQAREMTPAQLLRGTPR